jgi:large subunit ribosomal protein L17
MRHRKSINHLGRTATHRSAMLANMAASLILHKRIKTTTTKAKALRMYVEPLITKSKDDSTHARRQAFSFLQNKEAVTELFRDISPKIADRPGGYTRILKTGSRLGDNADMCIIELVDYNANLLAAKEEAAAKSGRRRRRGGKKKEAVEATSASEVTALETTVAEQEEVESPAGKADATPVEEADEVKDEVKASEEEETGKEKKEE